MKNAIKLFKVIALAAVIGFSMAACDIIKDGKDDDGGTVDDSADGTFTSIADFAKWLASQPENTAGTAYSAKLKINDLGGSANTDGSLGYVLYANDAKYVSLDLSGSTITSIPKYAFCRIRIDESNSTEDIYVGTVYLDKKLTSLTGIIMPNSVITIEEGAFIGCTGLTSVNIPDSVTKVWIYAFSGCTGLTNATIGNSVTIIGGASFQDCTGLASVTIGKSVATIEALAFINCTKLNSVTFADGSNITSFSSLGFPGNLDTVYSAASPKAGTYTRKANGSTWTKQN